MILVKSVLIVCHVFGLGVGSDEVLFVLTGNINVVDGQLCWARGKNINVIIKDCTPVAKKLLASWSALQFSCAGRSRLSYSVVSSWCPLKCSKYDGK